MCGGVCSHENHPNVPQPEAFGEPAGPQFSEDQVLGHSSLALQIHARSLDEKGYKEYLL